MDGRKSRVPVWYGGEAGGGRLLAGEGHGPRGDVVTN